MSDVKPLTDEEWQRVSESRDTNPPDGRVSNAWARRLYATIDQRNATIDALTAENGQLRASYNELVMTAIDYMALTGESGMFKDTNGNSARHSNQWNRLDAAIRPKDTTP